MPHFHFHVHESIVFEDDVGLDFPNLEAAKAAAMVDGRHLISEDIKSSGRFCLSHWIEIADPTGVQLHVIRYDECVEILP